MTETTAERTLQAVRRLLVTQGIEAVTMRNVASEAGVSVGAVQYTFTNKDTLIQSAMDSVSEAFMAELMALLGGSGSPQEALQTLCLLLAGALDGQRDAGVIWLAFVSKAATSPQIAEAHQRAWAEMEKALEGLLSSAYPGATSDDAATLLAVLDGLAVARVTEPARMPIDRARRIVLNVLSSFSHGADTADEPPTRP
jgi:AcrR family transcriptional regulator